MRVIIYLPEFMKAQFTSVFNTPDTTSLLQLKRRVMLEFERLMRGRLHLPEGKKYAVVILAGDRELHLDDDLEENLVHSNQFRAIFRICDASLGDRSSFGG